VESARGFSLVELVVVLVIAAILAALVLPRLRDTEINATWFQEEAKAAVRYAQRQAVAQRRSVFVAVTASQLRLCYDAGCATPLLRLADGAAYVLDAPSGVTLDPAVTFSFNGLGRSAGASFSVGGQTVTVTAETGHVP
jgi:MSHA pilin protein MshC